MNSRISKPKPHILSRIREILIWIGKSILFSLIAGTICALLYFFAKIALPFIGLAFKAIGS